MNTNELATRFRKVLVEHDHGALGGISLAEALAQATVLDLTAEQEDYASVQKMYDRACADIQEYTAALERVRALPQFEIPTDDGTHMWVVDAEEMLAALELAPEPAGELCSAETPSWDHYRPEQVDSYMIRCTRLGAHDEHQDSHTGLSWREPTPVCSCPGRGDGSLRWPCQAHPPKRRLRACVERWEDCETGDYHPSCCRFPKSCSADVYDESRVTDDDLEPKWGDAR